MAFICASVTTMARIFVRALYVTQQRHVISHSIYLELEIEIKFHFYKIHK